MEGGLEVRKYSWTCPRSALSRLRNEGERIRREVRSITMMSMSCVCLGSMSGGVGGKGGGRAARRRSILQKNLKGFIASGS